MRKNGTVYFLTQDHLGGTALVTHAGDPPKLVSRVRYNPYGLIRTQEGTLPTDKLYTGQQRETTAIYNYGARFYNADIGRFLSADSVVPSAGDPQALNRYSYVLNNPVRYSDPSGHAFIGEGSSHCGPYGACGVIPAPVPLDTALVAALNAEYSVGVAGGLQADPDEIAFAPYFCEIHSCPQPACSWQCFAMGMVIGVAFDVALGPVDDIAIGASEAWQCSFGGGACGPQNFLGAVPGCTSQCAKLAKVLRFSDEAAQTASSGIKYVPSPKHGPTARGTISAAPINGQAALDISVPVSPSTTTRRVAVDRSTGQFVVFDETGTGTGEFHGHVREWSGLTTDMKNALQQAGFVNHRGKILGSP